MIEIPRRVIAQMRRTDCSTRGAATVKRPPSHTGMFAGDMHPSRVRLLERLAAKGIPRLGDAAARRAHRDHTYDQRTNEILEKLA